MKIILSVSTCLVLFVCVHVESATDGDLQSLLARLSVLEEKQAFSEKRIAMLETENKLSQKRIADLEKYKTLSDRRFASLERKNALCNRKQDALDIVQKLYAKTVAIETDKKLSDTTTTTNGFDSTLSDKEVTTFDKGEIVSARKSATLENDYAVSPNRSGKDDIYTAAVETADRSTAVLQSKHRRFVAEGTVAFSAIKSAEQMHIGVNQNIIFDQVVTNEGAGYHPNHSVFIAPHSGIYVFSSTIICVNNGEADAAIVHNGIDVVRIYSHGDGGKYDQGSQTVVIKMNAGDEVAVRNIFIADNYIGGTLFSSFSGYLVRLQ